ncbi:hypothetical protein JCM3770_001243 [Rhodotorula araucariae]
MFTRPSSFFILMFGYKARPRLHLFGSRSPCLWTKSTFVRLDAMDFESGRRALDQLEEEWAAKDALPKPWWQRAWDWVM